MSTNSLIQKLLAQDTQIGLMLRKVLIGAKRKEKTKVVDMFPITAPCLALPLNSQAALDRPLILSEPWSHLSSPSRDWG